ncbi:MAG TPA: glycosyltransferase [Candidatus Kapabacteria bacterium]|nr:glycosyltransferase [Candidatus Kapabacteria bacterium]
MAEDIKNGLGNNLFSLNMAMISPQSTSSNGIWDYTARLIKEFRLLNPQCSIITPSNLIPEKKSERRSNWQGKQFPSHWPYIFLEAIDAAHVSLVHIQQGAYIGHGNELIQFLTGLHARRIPSVITLHDVWPPTLIRRWPVSFYRQLAENEVQVIIHQKAGTLKFLIKHGIPADRIAIIPHGTWTQEDIPIIPDRMNNSKQRIILFAGNIFPRKGLHRMLRAFPDVVRNISGACLLVVGRDRNHNIIDRFYCFWLRRKMRSGLKKGWLIQRSEYVTEEELWANICTADVTVFPYTRPYGSSSGIFHRVLAAGRPSICSYIPTFGEAIEAWGECLDDLILPPNDTAAWSRALIRILTDEAFRKQAMEASASLGRKTSWPLVAGEHLRLYQKLLSPVPS